MLKVCSCLAFFFFFKQKTAYEMRISDWSSDVCSSDLLYGSEDPGPSGLPMLLYRAPKRAWWADVSCPADEHGLASYDQWRMTAVWLQRAAPHLDDLEGLPPGPVLVEVEFAAMTSAPEVVPPPQSYTLALATIAVEARPSEGRILLRD